VPMAVAMLPEPMMLMVAMTCFPLLGMDYLVLRSCWRAQITVVPPSTTSSMPLT
jgi:hypothetical protein